MINGIISLLQESLLETLEVSVLILFLMVVIEFLVLRFKNSFALLTSKNRFWAYLFSSTIVSTPGCMGIFAIDSFYMAGLLPIGALAAAMITTLGDESFVLISMALAGKFPLDSMVYLYISLFIIGIGGGYLAYSLSKLFKLSFQEKCAIQHHEHDHQFSIKHFFTHHIYDHIIKKHILKIAAWVFVTVFFVEYFHEYMGDLNYNFLIGYYGLFIAALIGLFPISGPHIIFIVLFAQGVIPFSFLLVNSIVQEGHGLLPIMGFSWRDTIIVKLYKFILALIIGCSLFVFGI